MRLKTKFHFHSQAISLCNQCTERVVDLRLTIWYSLCGTFCINLTFHSSPPTFSVVGCHLVLDNRSEITADLYLTEQDLSSCTIIKCSSTLKSSEKSTETKWKPTHSYIKQRKWVQVGVSLISAIVVQGLSSLALLFMPCHTLLQFYSNKVNSKKN